MTYSVLWWDVKPYPTINQPTLIRPEVTSGKKLSQFIEKKKEEQEEEKQLQEQEREQ